MKKLIGYRVKDTNTGFYVRHEWDGVGTTRVRTKPISLTSAMVLADRWCHAGNLGHVVPVFRVSK